MVKFNDLYKRELTHNPPYGRRAVPVLQGSTFYKSFHFAKRFPNVSDLEALEKEFKIRVITNYSIFMKVAKLLKDMGGFPPKHQYIFAINGTQFKIRNLRWTPRIFDYIDFLSHTEEFSLKFALIDTSQNTIHPNKEVISVHTDFRVYNTPTIYASFNFFLLTELLTEMERRKFYISVDKIMRKQKATRKVR